MMEQEIRKIKIISRRNLIQSVAKRLGKDYTIPVVENVWRAIETSIEKTLLENENVRIRPFKGLVITASKDSKCKNYILPNGNRLTIPPRKWIQAKMTNHFKKSIINEKE